MIDHIGDDLEVAEKTKADTLDKEKGKWGEENYLFVKKRDTWLIDRRVVAPPMC